MKKKKISRSQKIILAAMSGGATLMRTLDHEQGAFYHLSTGKTVRAPTAELLIEGGYVAPTRDGLFGDSQSFRLAGEVACTANT